MSALLLFVPTSIFFIVKARKAASPSQPMMQWFGGAAHVANSRKEIVIPNKPVSSLLYELNCDRGPGTVMAPIIHWVLHANSIIHAAAA
jgi:hypothetical protein